MSDRRTVQIRESISAAQRLEEKNQALRNFVSAKISALHHLVALPEKNPEEELLQFITNYIKHVPDFIDALEELTQSAGIYDYAERFLAMAEDYFINPLELVNDHTGMLQLIDDAYLAHRLIEEINDRVTMTHGVPLAPMDMTMSNIIVHELLGEDFANQLDLAVHYAIESFFNFEEFASNPAFERYVAMRQQNGWQDALEKWPCLAGDSAISLDLEHQFPTHLSH